MEKLYQNCCTRGETESYTSQTRTTQRCDYEKVERPREDDDTLIIDPVDIFHKYEIDELDLDDNIYGAATAACFFMPLTSSCKLRAIGVGVGIATAFNFALQVYLIAIVKLYITSPEVTKLRQTYEKYHADVFPNGTFVDALFVQLPAESKEKVCQIALANPIFHFAFLFIWTSLCCIEIRHSMKKITGIFNLATYTKGDVRISTGFDENSSEVAKMLVLGVSSRIKFIIIGLIRLPEVLIAVLLWWVGCRWLTATNNFQDMILNSLALGFVSEIDEMVYSLLMPDILKDSLSVIKVKIYKGADTDSELTLAIGSMTFTQAAVVLLCFGYHSFQHVLPGYKNDIHEVCFAHYHEWCRDSLWSF